MAASSEPVLIFFKSEQCTHCNNLSKMWKDVEPVLKGVYPKLRISTITAKDNTGTFDSSKVPKDLLRYAGWFPMILLVPGNVWDAAMSNLGPKNPIIIKDGVQIMNGKFAGDKLTYAQKYDIRKPDKFGAWLKEALADKDFIRVQNSTLSNIPTVDVPSRSIQPLLTPIANPSNASSSYSSHSRSHDLMGSGDICGMRIISRPR